MCQGCLHTHRLLVAIGNVTAVIFLSMTMQPEWQEQVHQPTATQLLCSAILQAIAPAPVLAAFLLQRLMYSLLTSLVCHCFLLQPVFSVTAFCSNLCCTPYSLHLSITELCLGECAPRGYALARQETK